MTHAERLTLEQLETLTILKGSHTTREQGLCVMEAVAWFAGEPHSDIGRAVALIDELIAITE